MLGIYAYNYVADDYIAITLGDMLSPLLLNPTFIRGQSSRLTAKFFIRNDDVLSSYDTIRVKAINIPTFIPTINVSDLPTALAPRKLTEVKIKIIRTARMFTVSPD